MTGGYLGEICQVDLTQHQITVEKLDERLNRSFIGGCGTGCCIVFKRQPNLEIPFTRNLASAFRSTVFYRDFPEYQAERGKMKHAEGRTITTADIGNTVTFLVSDLSLENHKSMHPGIRDNAPEEIMPSK